MGGLLRLFDFSYERMARKVLANKYHDNGLEAPRNSFELQAETCQNIGGAEVEDDWHEEVCYPVEASMKKLINDELSKVSNTRSNGPSVVARLMGMDMLPVETKPEIQPIENKNECKKLKLSKKGKGQRVSVSLDFSKPDSSMLKESDSFYDRVERDAHCQSNLKKLRPREHPQEEELQKFKKEFLAWQAARFKEYAKVADISEQFIAQENLNMRKMELYSMSERTNIEKPIEIEGLAKSEEQYSRGLQNNKNKVEHLLTDHKLTRDLEESNFVKSDMEINRLSVPTKIVILRPDPEKISKPKDSWTNSSDTLEEKGSIQDFLEEVKERLKCELQGKSFNRGTVVRGSGIETPYSEKPSDPKHIARHIATQIRESVTRGTESHFLQSESTRSHRNENYSSGTCSPEFISRDTRKFLTDRMKNVLQRELTSDVPAVCSSYSKSSALNNGRVMQKGKSLRFGNNVDCWDIQQGEDDMQSRSFRHQSDDGGVLHIESPTNLVRSLSAPVSSKSFGKLLLEDRNFQTGAHIRRKHEGVDSSSKDARKSKKERFNLREKVSHLGHNLTLRGRLFGRKHHSATIRHGIEQINVKNILSGPAIMNWGEKHENFTEVPPSPVSVCSSAYEDFWRPADNVSLASTPDMTFGENISVSHVFRDISSNLNELRRKLNQLESDGPEDTMSTNQSMESEYVELEDPAEVYVRDLLAASGLYDGSSDVCLTRWDPFAKPISNSVFEQVEESYKKLGKDNENLLMDHKGWKEDHKVLFDLLNEALSIVLGPPVTLSKFRRKFLHSSMLPPLHGRKLLDTLWKIIDASLYPSSNISYRSLDNIVAHDLESTPWSGLIDDEVNMIGREVESLIVADLIEDITKDIITG